MIAVFRIKPPVTFSPFEVVPLTFVIHFRDLVFFLYLFSHIFPIPSVVVPNESLPVSNCIVVDIAWQLLGLAPRFLLLVPVSVRRRIVSGSPWQSLHSHVSFFRPEISCQCTSGASVCWSTCRQARLLTSRQCDRFRLLGGMRWRLATVVPLIRRMRIPRC